MSRVVIVPGRSLGPAVPQLLLPAFAAIRRGAEPTWLEWADAEGVDGLDPTATCAWVEAQLASVLDERDAGETLVVGKSLGTHAAGLAARLALPAVWVTPLLTERSVRDALRSATAPFLLVGGTADPFWDAGAARELTPHVLELDGADHGLFVPGPLARSAANIGALATAVERFLDETVWPVA